MSSYCNLSGVLSHSVYAFGPYNHFRGQSTFIEMDLHCGGKITHFGAKRHACWTKPYLDAKVSHCNNIVKLQPEPIASCCTAVHIPLPAFSFKPLDPEGFKLETNALNCIEPDTQEKVTLPCTYTGEDYEFMAVKWYRASRRTGCCARSVTDYKYWKVPVTLQTLRNHTAQSVTVQLIINHFNSSFSGLYFCQAYNPLYPKTPLRSEHITELTLAGSESFSTATTYTVFHATQMQS